MKMKLGMMAELAAPEPQMHDVEERSSISTARPRPFLSAFRSEQKLTRDRVIKSPYATNANIQILFLPSMPLTLNY